jgi:hypothetical protein
MIAAPVLVGFAESLAAPEAAWSLVDAGFAVTAFAREGARPPLASSRQIEIIYVPAPEQNAEACVRALRQAVADRRPRVVLPLDDTSVWLCDRLGPPTLIAGPTGPLARLALDKAIQLAAAEKAGLLVPPTELAGAGRIAGRGPWMVKPSLAVALEDGRLTRPTGRIATSPSEVEGIAATIPGTALVQPVIEGIGEGVFGLAGAAGVLALSAHRRVRMMNPRGSGSSACRSIPVDPSLVEPIARFVEDSGWRGIFMIELLRDSHGQPWFMELNGRAWGSMALARRRGLEYPAWAVNSAVDALWTPPDVPDPRDVVARHLGRELVHLLAVMRGARGSDRGRWPSRRETVAALLRREPNTVWYNARKGERKVFVRDAWRTVSQQLFHR